MQLYELDPQLGHGLCDDASEVGIRCQHDEIPLDGLSRNPEIVLIDLQELPRHSIGPRLNPAREAPLNVNPLQRQVVGQFEIDDTLTATLPRNRSAKHKSLKPSLIKPRLGFFPSHVEPLKMLINCLASSAISLFPNKIC